MRVLVARCTSFAWFEFLSQGIRRIAAEECRGYAAFTVSFSHIDAVADYIRRQEEHHKRKTFKEEYMEFLQRHEIPFEEKYLFDGEYVG